MLRTIEHTGQLLGLFTLENPEWGITDLAAALGWNTSKTHDLAASLAEIGLLKKSASRRYLVGVRVLELSQVVLGSSSLQVEARRGMEQFAAKYDETILLGVLAGGKILFADKIASSHALPSAFATPDVRSPAHCTSAGKVLLAYMSTEEREAIIAEHGLAAMTPKSIRSIDVLYDELARIREQGFGYTFEELVTGTGSIAAPIFDDSGEVVAALSVTASIQRFERQLDSYRRTVVRAAEQVSRRLGHMIYAP